MCSLFILDKCISNFNLYYGSILQTPLHNIHWFPCADWIMINCLELITDVWQKKVCQWLTLLTFKLYSNYQKVTVCILTSFNIFFKIISYCGVMRFSFLPQYHWCNLKNVGSLDGVSSLIRAENISYCRVLSMRRNIFSLICGWTWELDFDYQWCQGLSA